MILYTQAYYLRKCKELKDCSDDLETHLKTLNGLLSQIKDFSNDKHTEKHQSNLQSLIRKTESVKLRTDKMIQLYEDTIRELDFGDKLLYEGNFSIGKLFEELCDL